ncbi:uncharacterized protein LOC125040070 [Penaeus chinensis]|uniref:uncharacterized protein LOC125040070 n=1 Tax=Penaeus chinensis TaxID=139456 RepID=UPI001FB6AA3B|nr:uncharacterized protein LOC125040070 [Penaeus chinensis]
MFGVQLKLLAVLMVILILQEPNVFQSCEASDTSLRDLRGNRGTWWRRRCSDGGDGYDDDDDDEDDSPGGRGRRRGAGGGGGGGGGGGDDDPLTEERWKVQGAGPRNLSDTSESYRSGSATRPQRRQDFTPPPLLANVLLSSFSSLQRHHSSTSPLSPPSLSSSSPSSATGGLASTPRSWGLLVEVEQTSFPLTWRASGIVSATPPLCQRSPVISPRSLSSSSSFVIGGTPLVADDAKREAPSAPIYRTLEPEHFFYMTNPPSSAGLVSHNEGRLDDAGANGHLVLTSSKRILDEGRGRVSQKNLRASHSSPDTSILYPKTRSSVPSLSGVQHQQPSSRKRSSNALQGTPSSHASLTTFPGLAFQNLSSSSSSSSHLFPSSVFVPKTVVVPSHMVSRGVDFPPKTKGRTSASRARAHNAVSLIAPSTPLLREYSFGSVIQSHSIIHGALEGSSPHVPQVKVTEDYPKSRWFPYHKERLDKGREHYVKLAERDSSLGHLELHDVSSSYSSFEDVTAFKTHEISTGTSELLDGGREIPCRGCATLGLRADDTTTNPITIVLTSSHLAFPEPQTRSTIHLADFPTEDSNTSNTTSSLGGNSTSEIPITVPPLDVPEPSTKFSSIGHVRSCIIETRVSVHRHDIHTHQQIWSSASPEWFPEPQTIMRHRAEEAVSSKDLVQALTLESSLRSYPDVTFWTHEMITPMTTV